MSEGDNHTHFNVKKGMGLVSNIFNDEATKNLKGINYQCIVICTDQLLFTKLCSTREHTYSVHLYSTLCH